MRINMRIVNDHKQLLRTFRETHAISARSSSTIGYEKRRLETNHWTGVTQGTRNESCGYYGKWTSFLPFRVQLLGCEQKRSEAMTVRSLAVSGLKDRAD